MLPRHDRSSQVDVEGPCDGADGFAVPDEFPGEFLSAESNVAGLSCQPTVLCSL
jgi:hypothetical protein